MRTSKKSSRNNNNNTKVTKLSMLSNNTFDLEKTYNILNTGLNEEGVPITLFDAHALYRRAIVYLLGLEVEKSKMFKEIWDSDATAMEDMARQAAEHAKELIEKGDVTNG